MVRSYIGVASGHGLERLYSKEDHVVRFPRRRIQSRSAPVGLDWAALDDQAADQVKEELAMGETLQAFRTIQVRALHCGSILP